MIDPVVGYILRHQAYPLVRGGGILLNDSLLLVASLTADIINYLMLMRVCYELVNVCLGETLELTGV